MEGAHPGANGAQFTGKLMHDQPPNPHESQSKKSCIIDAILAVAASSNQSSMLLFEGLIRDVRRDFPVVEVVFSNHLYAVSSSSVVIFSMLSGVPFLSASTTLSLIESGISGSVNVRVPRTYSRAHGPDLQRSISAPHDIDPLNPTSPYVSNHDSHHSRFHTSISP